MPWDSSIYFPQQKKNDEKGPSKKCIGTHFFTSKDDLIPHKQQKKHKKNKRHEDSSRFKTSNFQTPWSGLSLVWQVVLFQVHESLAALDEIPGKKHRFKVE